MRSPVKSFTVQIINIRTFMNHLRNENNMIRTRLTYNTNSASDTS